MMSVASSTTPGIGENSCSTPSILTAVIAAPSIDDSSTRRRALPIVVPNPRSKGCGSADRCRSLLRIQLDDQLFLDGQVDLLAGRHRGDLRRQVVGVQRQPL